MLARAARPLACLSLLALVTACGDDASAVDSTTTGATTETTGEPTTATTEPAPTTSDPADTSTTTDPTTTTTTSDPGTTTDDATTTTGEPQACDLAPIELSHDAAPNPDAFVHVLDLAQHPEAVCNDGTPGTYIVRKGVGAASKRWLIYLEGGGQCATGAQCASRYAQSLGLMSSEGMQDGAKYPSSLEAIKSIDPAINPDFHDANYVQLNYCSSDVWSGDTAADPDAPQNDSAHWHFRGRKIVEATIADLQAQGLADADEVFLMGSSAGGLGVIVHADDVHASLAPTTRFVAMLDAGFFIDYPSYDKNTETESTDDPTERYLQLQYSAAVWGGRGDASCEAFAIDDAGLLACRSAVDVLVGGHITAPLLVRQSQLDAVQIKPFIPANIQTDAGNAYRERFADALRGHLDDLGPAIAVFSSHDTEHGIVNNTDEWSAAIIDGTSVTDAIGQWYRDPCGAGLHKWIEP